MSYSLSFLQAKYNTHFTGVRAEVCSGTRVEARAALLMQVTVRKASEPVRFEHRVDIVFASLHDEFRSSSFTRASKFPRKFPGVHPLRDCDQEGGGYNARSYA